LRRGLDMVVVDSAEVEAVGAKSRCLARPRAAAGCGDGSYMAKRMASSGLNSGQGTNPNS